MFNVFVKSVLYFILAICISWGFILILGPQIITLIVEKKFGDSVKFQSLSVEPDLTIKASRIEFYNAAVLPSYNLNGSVRAFDLNWEFGDNFIPIIDLSTGPFNLENSISYARTNVVLEAPVPWGADEVHFSAMVANLNLPPLMSASSVNVNGNYSYSNRNITSLKFDGKDIKDVSAFSGLKFKSSLVDGAINEVNFDADYAVDSIDGLALHSEGLLEETSGYFLKGLSSVFNSKNQSSNLELKIEELIGNQNYTPATDLIFTASFNLFDIADWIEIRMQIGKVDFSDSLYLADGSSLVDLTATVRRASAESFSATSEGSLENFDVISDSGILASLSGSKIRVDANFIKNLVNSKIYLQSRTMPKATLDSEIKLEVSSGNYADCLFNKKCQSQIWLQYGVILGSTKLNGTSYCVLPMCNNYGSKHIVKSENTAKFFENAIKTKIFNPLFLATLYGIFSQGKKVGAGHELQF